MLVSFSSSSSDPYLFSSSAHTSIFTSMDFPDTNPTGRSPRRELQGPRPTPLRIHKDSRKIKKPPLAPQPSQPQPPPRQPVIIYTVSPKIIHTTPGDFMSLVQRLTGSSSSSSSDVVSNDPFNGNYGDGFLSPAARYAAVEKARSPQGLKQYPSADIGDVEVEGVEVMMGHGVERQSMFHGILSPGPASLSPIPSSFFSPPPSDPSMVSFLHDLSPVLHGNRNFVEGGFVMPSPSNFVSPYTPSIDLFNYFLD